MECFNLNYITVGIIPAARKARGLEVKGMGVSHKGPYRILLATILISNNLMWCLLPPVFDKMMNDKTLPYFLVIRVRQHSLKFLSPIQ